MRLAGGNTLGRAKKILMEIGYEVLDERRFLKDLRDSGIPAMLEEIWENVPLSQTGLNSSFREVEFWREDRFFRMKAWEGEVVSERLVGLAGLQAAAAHGWSWAEGSREDPP